MKKIKCFLSFLLLVTLMMTTLSAFSANGESVSKTILTYSFANQKAGYAQGTITLTPDENSFGTYYLYWADDVKALDGYREIALLEIFSDSGEYVMPPYTAIPAGATKVIAVKSSEKPDISQLTVADAQGVCDIPLSNRLGFNREDMLYSFASIGDPQIANDSYGSGSYPYDEIHWETALETMAKREVDFAVSSGDIVNDQNGNKTYKGEYKIYQQILAESSYINPIYEAIGNHELWATPATVGIPTFIKETGLDSVKDTLYASKPYFEITEKNTGDHFIFMALEGPFHTNQGTQFSTAQLDWLENLLEKYSGDGKNIFIIEHGNIAGWGSGDKLTEPYYYDLGLNKNSADVARFISLMEQYKECVIITAHTHLELGAQLNYSDNDGTSAVMIHNSAIGGVRRLVNGVVDRTPVLGLSEGYIVEVYEDCILFNGINLYYNEIMPSCSYIVPFSTSKISYTYGDVDMNGEVTIKDATLIQQHLAEIIAINSYQAKTQAEVTEDGIIDINDVTTIQKFLAEYFTQLPKKMHTTDATLNFDDVVASVEKDLKTYYKFSSYNQYMALKKLYLECKDKDLTQEEKKDIIKEFIVIQENLYEIAGPAPEEDNSEITVYFTNSEKWSSVKAYVWGSAGTMVSWPGELMTFEKTNSYEQDIYSITLNYEDYQNIIFTDGSKQTVDIELTGENNVGYYISGENGGKYTCNTFSYQ